MFLSPPFYDNEPWGDWYGMEVYDIILNADGTITSQIVERSGVNENGELYTFPGPFLDLSGKTPVSVSINENGAYKCMLASGDDDFDGDGRTVHWESFYCICPVGVSSGISGYDDVTGTDTIRLRYVEEAGGVLDLMFYKTE